jgi:Xaa-Pro aminopeptidase
MKPLVSRDFTCRHSQLIISPCSSLLLVCPRTPKHLVFFCVFLFCPFLLLQVLKGHIGLSTAVFPAGTTGIALDPYARRPMWQAGLDYRHGFDLKEERKKREKAQERNWKRWCFFFFSSSSFYSFFDSSPLLLPGTGHGVGSFLNVHEGPIGISGRPGAGLHELKQGMIVTDGW